MTATKTTTAAAPPQPPAIDLRSDTVTRPSPGMRAAMAAAEVGDDVLGEDPTVARLQARVAELLGTEASLFVPSGTMANQIALKVHCEPSDEVIVSDGAHVIWHEMGGGAALAGVQLVAVGRGGTFTGADVEAAYRPATTLQSPTRLICVENTHNRGGGIVWPRAALDSVVASARRLGLRLHLDGARLMNASVATGESPAALAAGFDTVSLAFSKGLGAPVGSVIAGARPLVERAHRFRKMFGGGMRQAGVIAAAALYALDHNIARLVDDHANARLLGERLAAVPGLSIEIASLQSNIVMVDLDPRLPPAAEIVTRLGARGVLTFPFGPRRIRLVTHLDVTREECERAATIFAEVL
ncbi:MAG: threonine aldolase [Myxococcales bacterium]|jgi:threonine aldolase|nr:threonine aldolase [Myxococcales bacterium]